MSNLLLLLSAAHAQDACVPDRDALIAVPGPYATDVPVDIVPIFVIDDPECDAQLWVELAVTGESGPAFMDSWINGFYSTSWGLLPDTTYSVTVYAADTMEHIDDWEFDTGSGYAEPNRDPTDLSVKGWYTRLEDGSYEQQVELEFDVVTDQERVIVINAEDRRQLRATTTWLLDQSDEEDWVEWRTGAVGPEVCVWLTEYSQQGTSDPVLKCGDNDDDELSDEDYGCRTASVGRWSVGLGWFSRR